MLVKTGKLCKKGIQPDLNDAESEGIAMFSDKDLDEAHVYKIYCDKARVYIKHAINYKHIFQIWANQVYGTYRIVVQDKSAAKPETLTQTQLENVFPEFKHKLVLYDKCCDKNGKIVKNKEFYDSYKKTPHY